MELTKGQLKDLQNYIGHKLEEWGFDDETAQERLLLLVEEIGELVNAQRHERRC